MKTLPKPAFVLALMLAVLAGNAQAAYPGPPRDYYDNGYYRYHDNYDDYDRYLNRHDQGYYPSRRIVRCESRDSRPTFCYLDTRQGVRLVRRLSRSACIEGRSWGVGRDGIWVSRGCRADFAVSAGRYGYYQRRGYDRYRDYDHGREYRRWPR